MVVYICENFHNNTCIWNCFNLQSRHEYILEMAMFNVQRAITPKVGKPELQFMCSAHRLIMLYICVKFLENTWRVSELWSGHK